MIYARPQHFGRQHGQPTTRYVADTQALKKFSKKSFIARNTWSNFFSKAKKEKSKNQTREKACTAKQHTHRQEQMPFVLKNTNAQSGQIDADTKQGKHATVHKTAANAKAVQEGYADFHAASHAKNPRKRKKRTEQDPVLHEQAEMAESMWREPFKTAQQDQENNKKAIAQMRALARKMEEEEARSKKRYKMAKLQELIWGPSRYPATYQIPKSIIEECDELLQNWSPT